MARTFQLPALDRLAVGLSGLCVLHCLATVMLVSLLSGAGTVLGNPHIHEFGLAGAMVLAAMALGQGFRSHAEAPPLGLGIVGLVLMALGLLVPHGVAEVSATIAGVALIATAHLLNARLTSAAA